MNRDRTTRSIFWPVFALAMATLALISTSFAVWCYRRQAVEPVPQDVEPLEDRRVLRPASFPSLPGWDSDRITEALPALRRSCQVFGRRHPGDEIGPSGVAGTVADWLAPCAELATADDEASLRGTLERHFEPVQVLNNTEQAGLFTGYYEPSLRGSRSPSDAFAVPLYRKPDDLLTIDLESFHERYEGERISGRIGDDTFQPYFERAEIAGGALDDRGLELVWVDDPVDAFFLHIQGSGRVELVDGGEMRVGYEGQNGRPYFAIGRELVDRGALTLEEVSLQSIRSWLVTHPEEAEAVMSTNPSFVFFRELEGEGPLGTLGVALTPGRSLAVDRSQLPLGAPIWIDALAPRPSGDGDRPLRRLMVAQDTGGAIKGPVRGDVFWGHGDEAEAVAGRMKHEGRMWLLLPVDVVDRLPAAAQ